MMNTILADIATTSVCPVCKANYRMKVKNKQESKEGEKPMASGVEMERHYDCDKRGKINVQ